MRTVFIVIIVIHGVIHLFGFLKAFDLSELNAISQPITRLMGMLWLVAFALFAITAFFLSARFHYWQLTGLAGIILSQFLILNYWADAKFGTIINLIVLVYIILAYFTFNFKEMVKEEVDIMSANSKIYGQAILSDG